MLSLKTKFWLFVAGMGVAISMSACGGGGGGNEYLRQEQQKFENRVSTAAYEGCVAINANVTGMGDNQAGCADMHK